MDFQQSRTYQNLRTAYEYELQSKAKYDIFSQKASQDVFLGISFTFDTISRNDRYIASRLRNIINGGELSTMQNVLEARDNEYFAGNNLYQEFSRVAMEEGYEDISSLFSGIANIKLNHNLIFDTYFTSMQNNELFCKTEQRLWICLGCGNILSGLCAPALCPICLYPQGYYELFVGN